MDILQESPSRVLRRVNAYDDIELPSLPNFSQDLDFDTEETDDYYGGGGSEQVTHEDDEDVSTLSRALLTSGTLYTPCCPVPFSSTHRVDDRAPPAHPHR